MAFIKSKQLEDTLRTSTNAFTNVHSTTVTTTAIKSVSNNNIEVEPNGSGSTVIKGNSTSGSGHIVLNCEQNSHGVTLKGPAHSANANYTLTLPDTDGNANQVLKTDGNGNLDWTEATADLTSVSSAVKPSAANTYALGSSSAEWSDLYLGDGGYVYFGNDQDVRLQHIADSGLTLSMGNSQSSYDPAFTIKSSTGNTAGIGPQIKLQKLYTDANDVVGDIYFQGYLTGSYDTYGRLKVRAPAQTHGNLQLSVLSGNIETVALDIIGDASTTTPKVRIGNDYYLPTQDGSSGQAITTDGNGNLSFSTVSGASLTTQRITSNSITAQKDYRYVIDYNILSVSVNVTLPASPSAGDTIRFFSRYNNRLNFTSAGSETITRAGFTSEPYTELINLTSGIEIKAIYSGTEWVIESPTKELYQWSSNTSINSTVFLRYNTILLPYGTATYTLPDESTIPDGTYLEIIFTRLNANSNSESTVTFAGYNGNNEVSLAGVNSPSSPTSSVQVTNPRVIKIFKYTSHFIVLNPLNFGLNAINKNSILYTNPTSSSSFTAAKNHHHILETSSSNISVTLPPIDSVDVGDEILFSRNSPSTPGILTISLDSTDAATSSIYIQAPGLSRINNSGINSVSVPLTSGTASIKKIFDNGSTKEYLLTLMQSGTGPTLDITTTTETIAVGHNYLVDTAAAGGPVTITLPYVDAETVTYETFIKIADDTYDVIIDPYGSQVTIDDSNDSITLKAGNSKGRSISFMPTEEYDWKVLSDTHTNSNNYIEEITSSTTVSVPNYGASSETYTVNHATNAITVTLPLVADVPRNFIYRFKRIGAGTVTIAAGSGQYIDYSGQSSLSVTSQYDTVVLQNTGSFWLLLNEAPATTVITDSSGSDTTISSTTGIEEIHLINNTTNNVTITIPAASTTGSGYKYQLKRLGTGTVSVSPTSGTIDTASSFSIASQFDSVTLLSDGTNYHII